MNRPFVVLSVAALLVACGTQRAAVRPTELVVAPPPKVALPSVPPPADDPARDWHTFAPPPFEGGPFYQVADLNVTAPSVWGGACSLAIVEGATFLNCGGLARVDGARIDPDFPSPSMTTSEVSGRWPDDLWAKSYEGDMSDGYTPPKDVFIEADDPWFHYEGGKWKRMPAAGDKRHPYVGASSLLFVMPPVSDPKASSRAPACADYSCFRTVPRVITTSKTTKPDFSSLKDSITWLHHHDETEYLPDDFAFVVDPAGPVYVFMRAMDLKTKKKGFGVARWAPSSGASFDWLPGALAAKKRLVFSGAHVTKDHKVRIVIDGDAKTALEGEGRVFRTIAPWSPPPPPEEKKNRFFADGQDVKERMPDGSERVIEAFAAPYGPQVVTVSDDDVWVFTQDAVYRTVRPPEVLYRTESFGALHPFPKAISEGDECATPFAIFDATAKARADDHRRRWQWDVEGLVELEVHGQVVVGMPVKDVAAGEALLADDANDRMLEGAPHHVVCARAFGAKPFVRVEPDEPEGD